jgi:hypothetical protein
MDPSRDFWFIRVIIYVTSLRSILLIDLERGPKNFITSTKRGTFVTSLCSILLIDLEKVTSSIDSVVGV